MTQSTSNTPATAAPVPLWLLREAPSSGSISAYANLALHADEDGEITLTKAQLAQITQTSISTVYRRMKELEEVGAIESAPVFENRVHVATTYTFPHPCPGLPLPEGPKPTRDKYGIARRKISAAKRLAVYERDGFKCVQCGSSDRLTLDHITPVSRGGTDDIENLQTMCHKDNIAKGAK